MNITENEQTLAKQKVSVHNPTSEADFINWIRAGFCARDDITRVLGNIGIVDIAPHKKHMPMAGSRYGCQVSGI